MLNQIKRKLKVFRTSFLGFIWNAVKDMKILILDFSIGLRDFMFSTGMFSTDSKTILDVYCLVGDNTLTLTPNYFHEALPRSDSMLLH